MAETKQIGRVEEVDVIAYGRQPALVVAFKLADGSTQGLQRFVSKELLRDFMDVFPVASLSAAKLKLCWVTHTDSAILQLAPLMPDEGDVLELSQPEEQPAPAAPGVPTPAAAEAERKAALAATWKEYMIRARKAGADISAYRPKPGSSVEEIEQLLRLALTEIETAEEQAGKAVAA